ncbi:hypothetical protein BT63DRAFT_461317 [Microthyrium microscopicum]|uniref:BTB domain-containing protein n=1 Tax=Microthyrium microscopicum TaxID=703497 RepID=A0A6A6TV15_9PEZI|nr:hypothetical protein BT63DRAFT_461317 [Microthyrium microscopicum]
MADSFEHAFGPLFDNGTYSDVTVKCGPKSWRLHRSILTPQSAYFNATCRSKMKEDINNEIVLQDQDPEIVGAILKVLYRGPNDILPQFEIVLKSRPNANPFILWVGFYQRANYFQVPWIEKEILRHFTSFVDAKLAPQSVAGGLCWKSILPSLRSSGGPSDGPTIYHFVEAIQYAFQSLNPDLQVELFARIVDSCVLHLPYLMTSRCWQLFSSDKETFAWANLVMTQHLWGRTPNQLSKKTLSIYDRCWGCDGGRSSEAYQFFSSKRRDEDVKIRYLFCNTCQPILRQWLGGASAKDISSSLANLTV